MTRLPVLLRCCFVLSVGLWLTGCKPLPTSDTDDQKNPDFKKGEIRKNAMDYKGAVEAFEAALVRNPRSAAAHLELGLLYEHQMSDYATAIYHYQKHLALKPNSNVAEMIRGRIESCKLELVKSVALSTVPQHVQASMDRLATENAELRKQVAQLTAQLAQVADRGLASASPADRESLGGPSVQGPPPPASATIDPPAAARVPDASSTSARTHVVKKGETMYSIGRLYGFRNGSPVQAANPDVDPNKMSPGVILRIPPQRD